MIQKIVIFTIIVWIILSAQVHRQLLIKNCWKGPLGSVIYL
jgi:hypothetical protein